MTPRPPQSRRAGRSNLYSESKFTHWLPYNPYDVEVFSRRRHPRPAAVVSTAPQEHCPIYELPLHAAFVRPYTTEDVRQVLASIPPAFLNGLLGVFLLAGSRAQEKVSDSRLWRCGAYAQRSIYLHPFPRRCVERRFRRLPPPDEMHELERAGAVWESIRDGWICRFNAQSLRNFYLSDVLIHEVGHHVDHHHSKSPAAAERYARWFAQTFR